MGTPTYTPLAEITLGSSAASVTFSSISQAYRDLVLVVTGTRTSAGDGYAIIKVNSDSGSNYSYVWAYGDGSTAISASATGNNYADIFFTFNGTTPNANIINFMDYSATDKHKTILARTNTSSGYVVMSANRWASTSAVSSINISLTSFAAGTSFALYGIAS